MYGVPFKTERIESGILDNILDSYIIFTLLAHHLLTFKAMEDVEYVVSGWANGQGKRTKTGITRYPSEGKTESLDL
jgi:hypothetical protein